MLTRGPAYLSAAVLYESNVAESYIDPKYKERPFDVVAIYPKEGTFWADHPWAVLDLPTVTPDIREAAEVSLRKYLMASERQQARPDADRVPSRRHVDLPLGAPIDTAHGLDPPAQPKNVLPNPPVDADPPYPRFFSPESVKRPVAITFVLDTSGIDEGRGVPSQAQAPGHDVSRKPSPSGGLRPGPPVLPSETRWLSQGYGLLGKTRAPPSHLRSTNPLSREAAPPSTTPSSSRPRAEPRGRPRGRSGSPSSS